MTTITVNPDAEMKRRKKKKLIGYQVVWAIIRRMHKLEAKLISYEETDTGHTIMRFE
jgi:hypothetical protein